MHKLKNWMLIIYLIVAALVTLQLDSCALLPRTLLSNESGVVFESSMTNGKYSVHLYPIDNVVLAKSNKTSYAYKIGNRDQFIIYVWGHPEFSSPLGMSFTSDNNPLLPGVITDGGNSATLASKDAVDKGVTSYTVDENGNIFVPMIGKVKVEGMTIDQVRSELTKRLAVYVVNPQVSIRMAGYRSKLVYVLGEVNKPYAIYLNDTPLDLAGALSLAGWVNLSAADVKSIYVLRRVKSDQINIYQLDASSPVKLLLANAFVLQTDDLVFVSTAGVAQFGRVASSLVLAAQALWFTTNLVPSNVKIIN